MGDKMIPTVYCVLRSGGKYNAAHVAALQRQVAQHLSIKHRFICVTDLGVACESRALINDWPGWWSKIELFDQPVEGPCLYLDLDTIVCGPLDHLFTDDNFIHLVEDPRYPAQPNSSVMSWSTPQSEIYDNFIEDVLGNVHLYNIGGYVGDQSFLMDHAEWKLFEDKKQFKSFRVDLEKRGTHPGDCTLVMFHGKRKPWDKDMPKWINEFYSPEELKGMRRV